MLKRCDEWPAVLSASYVDNRKSHRQNGKIRANTEMFDLLNEQVIGETPACSKLKALAV